MAALIITWNQKDSSRRETGLILALCLACGKVEAMQAGEGVTAGVSFLRRFVENHEHCTPLALPPGPGHHAPQPRPGCVVAQGPREGRVVQ